MVDVIKPDKVWRIVIRTNSLHCPHLVYPANYHGCNYHQGGGDIPACEFESCPIKDRALEEDTKRELNQLLREIYVDILEGLSR